MLAGGADMKVIAGLNVCTVVIGSALMLAGCAKDYLAEAKANQAYADTCTKVSVPTEEQIRSMPTPQLYEFWQISRRASARWASNRVDNLPTDPCVVAIAWKQGDYERELKYR